MIGCIADDYTGGTDVAAALRRHGLRTVLLFGPPMTLSTFTTATRSSCALKSRALDAADAVKMSLAAQGWLIDRGVTRLYFKYCSTFDSTDAGNIGPVTDALLDAAERIRDHHLPGRTRARPHPLQRAPLRRGPVALGILDGAPPPDPDDRLRHRARCSSRQTPHPVGLIPLQVVRQGDSRDRPAT